MVDQDLTQLTETTGLDADQAVTWVSWWNSSGPVFQGKAEVTSGDTAANADVDDCVFARSERSGLMTLRGQVARKVG